METPCFPHRIEYTRNKHSRAVYRDNTIIIRLARNLTVSEEQTHIHSLLHRMTLIVQREQEKVLIDPFRPLLLGKPSLTVRVPVGRSYTFTLIPGSRTGAKRVRGGFRVTVSPQVRKRTLHRFLWSLLAEMELPHIRCMVGRVNASTFQKPIRGIRLRFATTQWGSCSTHGIIMLNTALLLLPPSLLQYIIIHELAHRRIANHSPAYWQFVARAMPRYREAYRLLQHYRLPQKE